MTNLEQLSTGITSNQLYNCIFNTLCVWQFTLVTYMSEEAQPLYCSRKLDVVFDRAMSNVYEKSDNGFFSKIIVFEETIQEMFTNHIQFDKSRRDSS